MNKCSQLYKKRLLFGKFCDTIGYAMKETVLTPDQENAKNLLAEWFFNTDDKAFVLSGYAGTGKTFLIDYVVREVLKLKIGV